MRKHLHYGGEVAEAWPALEGVHHRLPRDRVHDILGRAACTVFVWGKVTWGAVDTQDQRKVIPGLTAGGRRPNPGAVHGSMVYTSFSKPLERKASFTPKTPVEGHVLLTSAMPM